jgi:polyisoprenoid-binding protein YceI
MRISGRKSGVAATLATAGIGIFLSASAAPPRPQATPQATAQEVLLSVDAAQSTVHYIVDSTLHTVHGTFSFKSGTVHFDRESGKASGEIIVLASSGASGNSSRDEKMHKEVLQSDKFPEAVFRPNQIEGKVASSGSSDFKVHGTFVLRGSSHELVVPVHAELNGESWKGTGNFDVPYIQWGLKNPSNFLLKVQPIVHVEIEMAGLLKAAK